MKTFKRSVGFFLLAVMLCYCVVFPPFARADYTTNSNFWHWLDQNPIGDNLTGHILGYIASTDVCSESSDSKHHASSVTGVSADGYYICVCENCGNEFTSSNLASTAYDEYVEELPAQEINSDGAYMWCPTFADLYNSPDGKRFYYYCGVYDGNLYGNADSVSFIHVTKSRTFNSNYPTFFKVYDYDKSNRWNRVVAPVTGLYVCSQNLAISGVCTHAGVLSDVSVPYLASSASYLSGDAIPFSSGSLSFTDSPTSCDCIVSLPTFWVTPLSGAVDVSSTNPSDTYNIGTRAASLSGNFGTIDGNGNVQQVQATSIVDESTSTVYNPVTDTTSVITDWSYDYSDRSYTLTLDNGQTSTVTYGDQYITIQEGSQSYNVYYLVDSGSGTGSAGSGDSGSGETPTVPHTHSYTSAVTTPASCTLSGVRTYTCSCGASYTETIPATGHNWMVKDSVQTEYSSSGALIQEGFTIYRCSVCGEEYRVEGGSSPPIALNQDSISRLPQIVEMIISWFPQLSQMYQGYLGFFSDTFSFLPSDTILLFNFGIASSVVLAILKALRRT